jgi:hypothetical protein
MARICKINSGGGPVSITLNITNGLISGGDFKVYDFETGLVNETFKMATGNTGSSAHQSSITPSLLIGQVLSWQVLSCTPIITDSGTLTLEVFQDGMLCETEPTAMYQLKNVPACAINMALPTQGGLFFLQNP